MVSLLIPDRESKLMSSAICIYRIPMVIKNGMSTSGDPQCARMEFGDWQVKDLRFIDDDEILVALSSKGELF